MAAPEDEPRPLIGPNGDRLIVDDRIIDELAVSIEFPDRCLDVPAGDFTKGDNARSDLHGLSVFDEVSTARDFRFGERDGDVDGRRKRVPVRGLREVSPGPHVGVEIGRRFVPRIEEVIEARGVIQMVWLSTMVSNRVGKPKSRALSTAQSDCPVSNKTSSIAAANPHSPRRPLGNGFATVLSARIVTVTMIAPCRPTIEM